jgi:hypothetical protein
VWPFANVARILGDVACRPVYLRSPSGNQKFDARSIAMKQAMRFLRENDASVAVALHGASLSSVALCIALWIRAKIVGEDERGNAERRALFVGLWPPMLWLIGDTVGDLGRQPRERRQRWRGRHRVNGSRFRRSRRSQSATPSMCATRSRASTR